MLNRPIAVKFEKQQTNQRKKEKEKRNEILFSSKNYQHKHFRCLINYTNKSRASCERHRETLCVNFEACLFYTVIHEFPPHFGIRENTGMCIYHLINADMENTKVRMTLCNVTSPIQLNYLIEKM